MSRAWVVVVFASWAFAAGCSKRAEQVICEASTAKWRAVNPAANEQEIAAEMQRCVAAAEPLKTGVQQCVSRCYGAAESRDALYDCDRTCSVKIQPDKFP